MQANIRHSAADDDDVDSIGSLTMAKSVKFGLFVFDKRKHTAKHHIFHLLSLSLFLSASLDGSDAMRCDVVSVLK